MLSRQLFVIIALAAGFLILLPTASAQSTVAEPTYGWLSLGGSESQHTISLTSGGSDKVDEDGCGYGYVANAADVILSHETLFDAPVYIYVVGDGDTTLLIYSVTTGHWVCDDDSYGNGNPIIVLAHANPFNIYSIWVGSYSRNASDEATLYISETDPRGNAPSGDSSSGQVPDHADNPDPVVHRAMMLDDYQQSRANIVREEAAEMRDAVVREGWYVADEGGYDVPNDLMVFPDENKYLPPGGRVRLLVVTYSELAWGDIEFRERRFPLDHVPELERDGVHFYTMTVKNVGDNASIYGWRVTTTASSPEYMYVMEFRER